MVAAHSQAVDEQRVILVGGRPGDAAALASSARLDVVEVPLAEVLGGDGPRPSWRAVVVSLDAEVDVAALRGAVERAGARVPVVALAGASQHAAVDRWLAGGGDDVLFRDHLQGVPAVLARLERDRRARHAEEALQARLRAATSELLALAGHESFRAEEADAALRNITEAGARGLDVARCEVWLFDDVLDRVTLVDRYDATLRLHARWPAPRHAGEAPDLEALSSTRLVAVSEPGRPDLPASLGVGVKLGGHTVGALRFEHAAGPRRWAPGEEAFAGALADLTSLALESARRGRAERALLESERRFKELFLAGSDAIVLFRVSLDGSVYCEDFNPAAERMTGLTRDQVIGRQAHELIAMGDADTLRPRYQEAIESRQPVTYEHELRLPAGVRWFNSALVPLLDEGGRVHRIAAIGRDVTAMRETDALQRRLDSQVAELHKSEALGRLASHIAHDVNNLLTVIVAHAQRLSSIGGRPAEIADSILQATARGRELAQKVLTFGRRRPVERTPVDLAVLVRQTVGLLDGTAPAVHMAVELPASPVNVLADPTQMNQVITNLCSNALLAMPDGGRLTVRLELVDVDYPFALAHPPLLEGRWVRLSVQDSGVGMDEATRRRAFEPFFTTRATGGTGLGLAVVAGIVQGHEGVVVVDSEAGQGATFSVYLRPAPTTAADRPGAGQHLMLVDDHPSMARVSARLLETLGYRTTVFDDPHEALAALQRVPHGFDAVLTDLSMPRMSGQDFTRHVKELTPGLPVIVSSGMASELDRASLAALGVAGVLVKPWRLEEAMATLQRVLLAEGKVRATGPAS